VALTCGNGLDYCVFARVRTPESNAQKAELRDADHIQMADGIAHLSDPSAP
jgi:hypothetical protein